MGGKYQHIRNHLYLYGIIDRTNISGQIEKIHQPESRPVLELYLSHSHCL